jgi:hypothetical protein
MGVGAEAQLCLRVEILLCAMDLPAPRMSVFGRTGDMEAD